MSALNRRAAIKGVLTSVAVPAVVSSCAISPAAASIRRAAPYVPAPAPFAAEAELVRLGDELRKAVADHVPIWRRWSDLRKAFELEARRSLAAPLDTSEGWAAYEAISRRMGEEAASDENDRATEAIDALCERIHAIQPTTFAGMRSWYAALLWQAIHPRERELPLDHLDCGRRALVDFDATLIRLAGGAEGVPA